MREWLALFVIIAIVLVLLDGYRRKWQERRNRVVMKLDKNIPPPDDEDLDLVARAELPNGGARTILRDSENNPYYGSEDADSDEDDDDLPLLMETVDLDESTISSPRTTDSHTEVQDTAARHFKVEPYQSEDFDTLSEDSDEDDDDANDLDGNWREDWEEDSTEDDEDEQDEDESDSDVEPEEYSDEDDEYEDEELDELDELDDYEDADEDEYDEDNVSPVKTYTRSSTSDRIEPTFGDEIDLDEDYDEDFSSSYGDDRSARNEVEDDHHNVIEPDSAETRSLKKVEATPAEPGVAEFDEEDDWDDTADFPDPDYEEQDATQQGFSEPVNAGPSKSVYSKKDQAEFSFDTSRQEAADDYAEEDEEVPEVEEVIIINVMARPGELLSGAALLPILMQHGMRLGDMSIFHRHADTSGAGPVMFSMANMVKPGTFDMTEMENFTTPGICFFLQMPNKLGNMSCFEKMLAAATAIRDALNAEFKDENRSVFTKQTIEHCRQRIRDFELSQLSRR